MYAQVTGADANGMAIESTNESDWGVTWEDVKAKADELEAGELLRLLREERNMRIAKVIGWLTVMLQCPMNGVHTDKP